MKKINKFLYPIISLIFFTLLFYLLFNASFAGVIYPFAYAMFFALCWANQPIYFIVPAYLCGGLLSSLAFENVINILVTIFVMILPYFIHILIKKNIKKWEICIYAVLSQSSYVIFSILNSTAFYIPVLHIVIGLIFMLLSISILEAVVIRGVITRFTRLEILSVFVIVIALCAGLADINIYGFSLLKLFVSFTLLVFAYCAPQIYTLLFCISSSLGVLISTTSPLYFAPFMLWGVSVLLSKKRWIMCLTLICVEIISMLYFNVYASLSYLEVLPVVISCVLFLIIPKRYIDSLTTLFSSSNDRLAMKNLVNRNREILHKRLCNLSEVFNNMNIIYRNMIKKNMTKDDVVEILIAEIKEKICSVCPDRNHCHRTFAENTRQVFTELITVAFDRGKVTILDVPSYLTSRCKQTASILGGINSLTSQYKKYISMIGEVDTSKLILADQLLGISKVLSILGKEVDGQVSFDITRESKIIDELTYHNIICVDAVVFEQDIHTQVASLVVRNEDKDKFRIVDSVSKVCGKKMTLCDSFPSTRPGYTIMNLKTAPRFDCVFGVAQKAKNGKNVSGDTYSILKLDGERILFAISDGMGSGEKAGDISELAISLVENFYKAGFENELILSTINKLLNLYKEDIFSALDIGVLDLNSGIIDFIKMASPASFILNKESLAEIRSTSLPMGIVTELSPIVQKKVVSSQDFVILMSDGVSDAFKEEEELEQLLRNIKSRNPQEVADFILSESLSHNNGCAEDDASVLVVKIFEN